MELSDYRQQIDGIDSQLLALFYQRMEVAAQIAGYKKAHNLPALDAGRERAKLQQIADAAPEDLREYAVSLYSLHLRAQPQLPEPAARRHAAR